MNASTQEEQNLLYNGYFEGGTSRENITGAPITQIEGPAGWGVWWIEQTGDLIFRPESQIIKAQAPYLDPPRVFHGDQAFKLFKSWGRICAGLYQRVALIPGREYDLRAYAHAWSNHPETGPCASGDDPHCSAGVGTGGHFILEGEAPKQNGDPANDAIGNFVFRVAVSFGADVVPWDPDRLTRGQGAHIYNRYYQIPELRFTAEEAQAVVYIGAYTLWPYKHTDAYIDSAVMELVPQAPHPGPCRGAPREQYERTYILLPQQYGADWWHAAVDGGHKDRNTVGSAADDAGIGDLDVRIIKAVNPGEWDPAGSPDALRAFFADHYPGTAYEEILAGSPEELTRILKGEAPPPPPSRWPVPGHSIGLHLQGTWPGWDNYVTMTEPGVVKLVGNIELAQTIKRLSPNTHVAFRQWIGDQDAYLKAPDKRKAARDFIARFRDSLEAQAEYVDIVLGLNEYIGTDDLDGIRRGVEWSVAFAEELAATGLPVVPGLGSVAMGNPQHGAQVELMAPMAQACIDHLGVMFYHGYWGPFEALNDPDGERYFYHLAGRSLTSWDPTWAAMGLDVSRLRHALGEMGVVAHWGGDPNQGYNPGAGWKDPQAYAGDFNLLLVDLLGIDAEIQAWNAANGNRCIGGVVFTTGPDFINWLKFQYRHAEMAVTRDALIRTGRV